MPVPCRVPSRGSEIGAQFQPGNPFEMRVFGYDRCSGSPGTDGYDEVTDRQHLTLPVECPRQFRRFTQESRTQWNFGNNVEELREFRFDLGLDYAANDFDPNNAAG
jgi:hypothetical protein